MKHYIYRIAFYIVLVFLLTGCTGNIYSHQGTSSPEKTNMTTEGVPVFVFGESNSRLTQKDVQSTLVSAGFLPESNQIGGGENTFKAEIAEGVEVVEKEAFMGQRIVSVVIPESVTEIHAAAFYRCADLEFVNIPKNVSVINKYAFNDNYNLKRIDVSPDNPYFISDDGVLLTRDKKQLLCYPGGRNGEYQIPEGITELNGDFWNTSIEHLVIPRSVKKIGAATFRNSKLKTIVIPKTVNEIEYDAFQGIEPLPTLIVEKGSVAEKYAKEHHLPTATTPTITRYDLKELKQNTIEVSEKTLTDLDIVTEHDRFVLLNNKKDQFHPYKGGYFYWIEKGGKDGPNDVLVYDDRQGNITERGDLGCIVNIIGDSIYYIDAHGCLKCNENGNVISFDNCCWGNVFFTEQFIYYIEEDNDNDKSYLYRVNYDGKDKQKLYEFGFCVTEMRLYRDKLWFTYRSDGKDRFGVLDLSTNQIATYDKVRSNGYSLGTGIIINGKYIYYTDPDLKRLNVEDNSVEEVLNKNIVSMGFVDNRIICCTNSAIYLVSDKGAKRLKTPLMKDEFFSQITIDDNRVYVETQAGAFFWRVRQIDPEGNVIMKVYSS